MFCVECGAEGPVYEGLCANCFRKRHPIVAPVEFIDVPRCQSCGSYRLRSGWTKADRDLVIPQLLREAMPPLAPYERLSFTHVAREEDANNLSVRVKAAGRFQELTAVQDFQVRIRIKPSYCDACQKQRGRYYEGILQVRGEDRELAPREVRAARTFVAARIDRSEDPEAFVSRIEEVHGDLDFYVSTNALAKGLARDLAGAFGGTVTASPKLFGQRQGREVYRVTALVRLPAFQKGDVVRHKGAVAEVTSVRPFVVLRDLATGESSRFKPKDVRGASRRRLDLGGRVPVESPARGLEGLMGAEALTAQMTVALGCRALDDLLGGGVEEGCITLLHGEAGSGKTNFCLQLARNVVRAGHKVIYIDTEGVSLERLRQICGDDFEVVAKNILFSEPYSFEEQEKFIEKAVKLSEGNREVGLIVIDSITMHYRLTMRDETRREERYGLTRQIAKLLRVSRERGIPVVVTSQVYTDIDTGAYMPLGGHMLSHNAKTIVRFERTGPSTRTAVLDKHRHREEGTRATFRITGQGLED